MSTTTKKPDAGLSKANVWKVGAEIFGTEAEADAYMQREQRIEKAAALLDDLQTSLTSPIALKVDPVLRGRARSSATINSFHFSPQLVARALALHPEILGKLQAVLTQEGGNA